MPADITLVPADDDTYAVLPRATAADAGRREDVRRRLTKASLGWFLGWDPKAPADRAEIERRVREFCGSDLTVAWA